MMVSTAGIFASTILIALVLCLQLQSSGAEELPAGRDDDGVISTGQGQRRRLNISTTTSRANVVNATYNEVYDDSPSNIASSSSLSSCASPPPSSDIMTAMRNKYAFAAFRRPSSDTAENTATTTTTTTSYCGQCLKLTNLETEVEAMVRIVHEDNSEGLELDRATFNKLRSYGTLGDNEGDDDDHHHYLVLKYQFEDCQD